MPADLASRDERIVVHDRSGNSLPFSRGIMATSLLATGIPTEEAYRLASAVQQRLLETDASDLAAEDLVAFTKAALGEIVGGHEIAERWESWRQAKRTGRPLVIVLGGAPGVGKSTIATRLAVRLDITRVVTTDAIREVLRTVVPVAVLPELHQSTFELVVDGSIDPYAGFDRQCDAVGAAGAAVADRLAREHRSMIIEGVHIRPGTLSPALADHPAEPIVVERLIVQHRIDLHKESLRRRGYTEPLRAGHRHLDGLDQIRSIQDHLLAQADLARVPVIDIADTAEFTQDLVHEIVQRVRQPAVTP